MLADALSTCGDQASEPEGSLHNGQMADDLNAQPPTLSERLATWACQLALDDIPQDVVARLKTAILQDLVMGLIAHDDWQTERALRFIQGGGGSPGRCCILGQAGRAAPVDAAYANAVMIRAVRQEDSLMPSGIHGVAITLPVAIALAEQHGRSGADLLTAMVAGCEVAAVLDRAAPDKRMVRTSSHTYGAFAAAVTAARLLGLDIGQTAVALAYAGNIAAMIQLGFEDHQYAILARNGMTAAYLGQARAPAPRDALEGSPGFYEAQLGGAPETFEPALASLGVDFALTGLVLKPAPGTLNSGVAVILMSRIIAEHGLTPEQVMRIVVSRAFESNDPVKHAKGPFILDYAGSSMPFAFAATLLDGGISLERFKNPNVPEVFDITRKVEFRRLEGVNEGLQQIEVHTIDGRVLRAEGDYRLLRNVNLEEIVRFHGKGPDTAQLKTLTSIVGHMEHIADISPLISCLAMRPAFRAAGAA